MSMTQKEIAAHLCMSDRNLRDVLAVLEIDWRTTGLDDIRKAYILHLRAQAAGHQSSNGDDLISARIRNESASAELKELQLAEKRNEVIHAEAFYQLFAPAFRQIKAGVMQLPQAIARYIKKEHGITIDVTTVSQIAEDSIAELARYEQRGEYDAATAAVVATE